MVTERVDQKKSEENREQNNAKLNTEPEEENKTCLRKEQNQKTQ